MSTQKVVATSCAIFGYATFAVSLTLTLMFMHKIAGQDKLLISVFFVVGFVIEGLKALLPIIIFYTLRRGQVGFGLLLGALYIMMTAISFNASASTIEDRLNHLLQKNEVSVVQTEKANIIKGLIDVKKELFLEQKSVGHITKMDKTAKEIGDLNNDLLELVSSTKPQKENIISTNKMLIVYIVAALIELIAPIMALIVVLNDSENIKEKSLNKKEECDQFLPHSPTGYSVIFDNLSPYKKQKSTNHEKRQLPAEPSKNMDTDESNLVLMANSAPQKSKQETKAFTSADPINENKVSDTSEITDISPPKEQPRKQPLKTQVVHAHDSDVSSIKVAILNRVVKPNHRSIREKINTSRDAVVAALEELEIEGKLIKGKGNRYYIP